FNETTRKNALDYYKLYYLKNSVVKTVLYPNVAKTLDKLETKGIKAGIVSNKPEELVVKILKRFGIFNFFTCVFGPESLINMKPSSDGLLKVLSITGDMPENSVMVGDSDTDIIAGKAAGCHTCGILYGIGDKVKLLSENADFYIAKIDELFNYIM
ncbi:MAG: HAD-IA family hydrolase, partial [Clostridiales bacterium]|nr:HAD-IA family hydrolase [Clostridiales bacterium]